MDFIWPRLILFTDLYIDGGDFSPLGYIPSDAFVFRLFIRISIFCFFWWNNLKSSVKTQLPLRSNDENLLSHTVLEIHVVNEKLMIFHHISRKNCCKNLLAYSLGPVVDDFPIFFKKSNYAIFPLSKLHLSLVPTPQNYDY